MLGFEITSKINIFEMPLKSRHFKSINLKSTSKFPNAIIKFDKSSTIIDDIDGSIPYFSYNLHLIFNNWSL